MTAQVTAANGLTPDRAAAVTPLALALWIWDVAGLELGETAIYTSGSPVDLWVGRVACWRSVRDVIRLDLDGGHWKQRVGITNQKVSEPQETVSRLSAEVRSTPGVVAVILTPEAVAADVILEALPMWARIVLATPTSRPATIDFYNNVHRKGTRILSVPGSPEELLDPCWNQLAASHLARAARILKCEWLASQCMP